MTQWKKLLNSLGFSESEVAVYLASIKIGQASVQDLAKAADVSRVTAYAVIEALTSQGLMSSLEKGKKKMFIAESPERLVSFVQARLKHTEATLKEVEANIGDLKLIQKGEKPVVRLFEGEEALRAIQEDVLIEKPEEALEFGNLDRFTAINPFDERKDFFKRLLKLSTKRRSIYYAKDQETGDKTYNRQLLPATTKEFFGDIYIYKNKVALSTLRGRQISVLIESQDLADTFRAFFEYAWKNKEK